MPAVGDLPNRQRVPRIGDREHWRFVEAAQQVDKCKQGHNLAADEREPHACDGFGKPGDRKEEKLRNRRIDRGRVVGAVDVEIDERVTQLGELRIGRNVAIRVDAGALYAPVPDVAVDIG